MKNNLVMEPNLNFTSQAPAAFTVNKDMLNSEKAMKYINHPQMLEYLNEICAAIKEMNSEFSPLKFTDSSPKKDLVEAYHRFYRVYMDLRDREDELLYKAQERAEIEEFRRRSEKERVEAAKVIVPKKEKTEGATKESKSIGGAPVKTTRKSTPRIGDASERLTKYSQELTEKEALVANTAEFTRLSREESRELLHRINSLKRKIERANAALNTNKNL